MVCENREGQPIILHKAVKKLTKNGKNSALIQRDRVCLSEKCAVYTFGDAMQQSGQPDAFPTGLFLFYDAASEGYASVSGIKTKEFMKHIPQKPDLRSYSARI